MRTLIQISPLGPVPRAGAFATRTGSYEPAIRLRRSIIDLGDTVEAEVFVTGYGSIAAAKLAFYPSPGIFIERESRVQFNFRNEGGLIWGGTRTVLDDAGCVINLVGGPQFPGWQAPTLFFDLTDGGVPQIATETKQVNAPFEYTLVTHADAAPGSYALQFLLTYYNGEAWCIATQEVSSAFALCSSATKSQ